MRYRLRSRPWPPAADRPRRRSPGSTGTQGRGSPDPLRYRRLHVVCVRAPVASRCGVLLVPVLAKRSQYLAAVGVREHAREWAVLAELTGHLVYACEHLDDVIDAAVQDVLP